MEQTTFHFCMQQKHLQSGLDRFAQFFIKPLMKRDAITREREAVESGAYTRIVIFWLSFSTLYIYAPHTRVSEYQIALPSDLNKKIQLQSSFACDGHPVKKFSWGNQTTLRDNVSEDKLYEELHKFRERHYSAHRMRLAIQVRARFISIFASFSLVCLNPGRFLLISFLDLYLISLSYLHVLTYNSQLIIV